MNHALLCRSGALGYVRHLTLSSFSGAAQWPTVKGCGLTQNFEFVELYLTLTRELLQKISLLNNTFSDE